LLSSNRGSFSKGGQKPPLYFGALKMRYLFTSLLIATGMSAAYAADAPTSITPLVISTNTTTSLNPSIIEMQTNIGTVTMELDWNKAPISSKNFLDYTNKGFYKNTVFHRTVKQGISIVQGGGLDAQTMQFKKNTLAPIKNESSNALSNLKGTVAMARTAEPDSATSQFFFNFADNLGLNKSSDLPGYAVFANVIGGMDIVTQIGGLATLKTSYSAEGTPYLSTVTDCGFNFCLKKVIIENIYTSKVVDSTSSITRVTVNGTGGKITSSPAGISCTSTSKAGSKSCVLTKPFGTAVSLISTPSKGYEMRGWSGDCKDFTTPLVLDTKTKNNNCTATFAKIGS
jgi:peptidyl-prolyl cis-trans isomerase A (cyclophilin A)